MSSPQCGDVFGTRYRLEKRLGRGGMACVWEAYDRKLKRRVALKVLLACHSDKDDAIARFAREARVVAQLQSPHIVQLHDVGVHDGERPYIVMELLRGEQLNLRLSRCCRLPLEECARIAEHLGKALATAHAAGIVHRDLKPGNVFLVSGHGEEIVKVFDFGISKALQPLGERALTHDDLVLGTPRYMSPEQITGADVDRRADLWALGVIAYRACTGRLPFDGADLKQLIHGVTVGAVPSVEGSVPNGIVAALDAFFARALAKDPRARFDDALSMSDTLVGILARAKLPPRPSLLAEYDDVIELDEGDLLALESQDSDLDVGERVTDEPHAEAHEIPAIESELDPVDLDDAHGHRNSVVDLDPERDDDVSVADERDVAPAVRDSDRPLAGWETTVAIPLDRALPARAARRTMRRPSALGAAAMLASCCLVISAAVSLGGSVQTARAGASPRIWIERYNPPTAAPSIATAPAVVKPVVKKPLRASVPKAAAKAAAEPLAEARTAPERPAPEPVASSPEQPERALEAAPIATPADAKPRGRALFEEPW